nr:DUF4435 domain-containing protein [Nitrosomonas nitrosa]
MNDERKTVEELIVRYELEPTLRDVYVEGEFDAFLLRWFFHDSDMQNVCVYEIGTVEISHDLLAEARATNNNKGRVIALAHKLQQALGDECRQVTFVVDKDFDHLLQHNPSTRLLLITDYSCMEMYLFNQWQLEKFCTLVLQATILSIPRLLKQMGTILQELYLLRFNNIKNSLGYEWMSFIRCCELRARQEIIFNKEDFLVKYLHKNRAIARKVEVLSFIDFCRPQLASDHRMNANGHDFFELLEWLSKQLKPSCFRNSEAFRRAFLGCLETSRIRGEPLFSKLLQWHADGLA